MLWSAAFDLVRCRRAAAGGLPGPGRRGTCPARAEVAIVRRPSSAGPSGCLVAAGCPRARPAARSTCWPRSCRAGLAPAADDQQVAVALTRGLARDRPTTPALLRRWLRRGSHRRRRRARPALRWTVVHRLAALGDARPRGRSTGERQRDGTIVGVLGAATARAALPTPEAKAAAWALIAEAERMSNRMFTAVVRRPVRRRSRPTWWRRTSPPMSAEAPRPGQPRPGLRPAWCAARSRAVALTDEQLADARAPPSAATCRPCCAGAGRTGSTTGGSSLVE